MADRKITDLTALTTPASTDVLPIVDVSEAAAADKNKKITVGELFKGVPDGSAAAPAIAFETDDGNGLFLSTTDTIGIATNGVSRATVSTTAVTSTLPVIVPDGSAAAPSVAFTGSGTDTGFYSAGANQVSVTTNGVERINIQGDGNINIDNGGVFYDATSNLLGIGTTSPTYKLEVSDGTVTLACNPVSGFGGYFGTKTNHDVIFLCNNTEKARLDTSGRLLVGTSSSIQSTSKLQIKDGSLNIYNASAAADAGYAIIFTTDGNSSALAQAKIEGLQETANTSGGRLVFSTSASGSGTPVERMRIHNGGDITIGKTLRNYTTAGVWIQSNGVISSATAGLDFWNAYNTTAGAYRFWVSAAGTINATSTTISAISDIRFKENIQDIDRGLAEILALKPRKFDWKEGKGRDIKNDRGFIAQEFEKVFPDLIDEWKDPAPEGEEPYKSVRQDLIPVLVKAVQEQQAMITELQAEITALKAQ